VRFLLLNSAPPIKWKIDSAISNPELLGEKDLPVLASLLTKDVYEKLHAEFPSAVIPVGANRLGPQPPNQDYAATCAHIGSTYQTKYLIHIIIDSFTFDLNVLTGNTYKMSVSGYIIDASTGQKIFALKEHTIKETTWVKDQVMGWRAYAQQKLVPHVAKYIVENISAPIHTRIDQGQRSAP
jgi:hypothetical protein